MSSEKSSGDTAPPKSSFWTPGRIIITLAAIGLVTALGLSSCNSNETPPTANAPTNRVAPPPNTTSAPAPVVVALPSDIRDSKLQTLDGESLKLSDYDKKVVVVNIWAT